jgi:ribosomal protein L37E
MGGMGYIFMDEKSKRNRQNERVTLRCIISEFFLKRNRIRGCGLDSFEKERRKNWQVSENDDEICGSHKTWGISRAGAQLPDFQNRPCSIELVNCKQVVYFECSCVFTTLS